MTKTFICVVTVVIMLSIVNIVGFSDENLLVKICPSDGKAIGTVDVSVHIENNPGIATFLLNLTFDNTKLEPLSLSSGSVVSPDLVISNIQSGIDLSQLHFVSAFWSSPTNVTQDGTLYTATFKVKQGATGTVDFGITYHKGSIANSSLIALPYESVIQVLCIEDLVSLTLEIENCSLSVKDDTIQGDLEINVNNHYSITKHGDLFVAVYDSTQRLIWTTVIENNPFSPMENKVYIKGISIQAPKESTYSVSIMCWDHTNYMQPLAIPYQITLTHRL